jgi:hypothetical protein
MPTKEQKRKWANEYYHRNKEVCKERHFKWYIKNKAYVLEQQRLSKRNRKQMGIELLGGKCAHCLQTFHPSVYEFHHTNPEIKDKDPSKMSTLKLETYLKELEGCILLCANCHRYEHNKDKY